MSKRLSDLSTARVQPTSEAIVTPMNLIGARLEHGHPPLPTAPRPHGLNRPSSRGRLALHRHPTFSYRPEAQELEILFTTGRRYVYFDVPEDAAAALKGAFNKGRHFNRRIRDRFQFSEIAE